MRMHTVIVDGYNVIHRVPRFKTQLDRSLQAGREALLRYCSEWRTRRRDVDLFYVVFDGDSSVVGGELTASAPGVKAIYSQTGETADRRIQRMLEQADRREVITVVSDDNEVRDSARVNHMKHMSVNDFAQVAAGRTAEHANRHPTKKHMRRSDTKASLPPRQAQAITDELRNLWNI